MSVQPVLPAGRALERLFTPGIRLGWTFRDRSSPGTPYLEPAPDPGLVHKQIAERVAITQSRYARARRWVIKPALLLGLLMLLLAGYENGTHHAGAGYAALAAAVVITGSGLGYTIRSWWRKSRAAAARPERSYGKALKAWQQRAVAHEQAELARAGDVPEWSPAIPAGAAHRCLRRQPGRLAGPADHPRHLHPGRRPAARRWTCPASSPAASSPPRPRPPRYPPPSTCSPPTWAGAACCRACRQPSSPTPSPKPSTPARPGGARADRAVDVRVLEQLAAALGGWITPARLAAAAQAALGHPAPPGLLSAHEEALIGGDLFPRDYRQQITPNLVRLDAFLIDLARYTGHTPPVRPAAPSYYTCLAVDAGARSARAEMLTALAIGWLTVQVSASDAASARGDHRRRRRNHPPPPGTPGQRLRTARRPAHHHVPAPARGRPAPARRRHPRVHAPGQPRRSRASR